MDETWKAQAACKGKPLDLFFPEKGNTAQSIEAQILCFGCAVRVQCKDYKNATHSTDGIWAGEYSQRGNKADDS